MKGLIAWRSASGSICTVTGGAAAAAGREILVLDPDGKPAARSPGLRSSAFLISAPSWNFAPTAFAVLAVSMVARATLAISRFDLDFDLDLFHSNLRDVNPDVRTIETSAKTGDGVEPAFVALARKMAAESGA